MRRIIVGYCIAALVLFGGIVAARAHGEYAWINEGAYKSANGTHCCGWNDCMLLSAQDVMPVPQGHATPHGIVPPKATYQSRDGKIWMCRWWLADPASKCLFIPGAG